MLAARHLGCGQRHGDTAQCMSTEASLSITLNATRCWKEGSHFDLHQQKARSGKQESVMSLQLFVTVLVICDSLFGLLRFLVGLVHASYSVRHMLAVTSLAQEATQRVVSRALCWRKCVHLTINEGLQEVNHVKMEEVRARRVTAVGGVTTVTRLL
jgi:hypothetical protein